MSLFKRKGDLTAGTFEGEKVPGPTKWVFSSAGLFRDALYALVSGFLMTYIMYSGVLSSNTEEYNQQIGVITILFVIFLIWDGINDPLFGIILEKCHFKSGKFRPWILIGGILNSIVVALLFCIRPTGWAFVAFWAVFYFLWDAVFTLNDIGYWSMLPSLTSDEKERNRITTLMSIFISIGSFSMYALCSVLPNAGNYTTIYTWIAIPACILFGLSQIVIFFVCKEKKRDPVQDEVSQKTKFRDLFTILKINKPLRISVIGIFLYYIGSGLMIGIGTTYFYLIYGYGGSLGGLVALIFTVMYVLGTLISQLVFTPLSKKFSKQQLLTGSCILAVVSYVVFFLVGVPIFGSEPLAYSGGGSGLAFALGGTMFLNYIPAFCFFFAEGIFYLVLLMMMQNSIEYNEWKYGERKEAVAFSWRPLDAKFSSAIQKGVIYTSLLVTGLYESVTSKISTAEQEMADTISAHPDQATAAQETAKETIDGLINGIQSWQKVVLGACMVGSVIVCILAAYFVVHFGYDLNETKYAEIVKELDVRRQKDAEDEKSKAEALDPSAQ